jgi:hypothetical protein
MPNQQISMSNLDIFAGDFATSRDNSMSTFKLRDQSNERRGTKPRNLYAVKSCNRRRGERRSLA